MQTDTEWTALHSLDAAARARPQRIEKMAYRAAGTLSVSAQPFAVQDTPEAAPPGSAEHQADLERMEQRLRQAEADAVVDAERAREQSRADVERTRQGGEVQLQALRQTAGAQVGAALASFRVEREAYFGKVEQEVVRLALAIAARILNREALLDPLLLSGAVRVALGQLGETTDVRLRCPLDQVSNWREMLLHLPDAVLSPKIEGDPGMAAGDCVLEARIGNVDLGVRSQLIEIERGFFDLLEQRPGSLPVRLREPEAGK